MNLVKIDIGKPVSKSGWNDNDGWLCTAVVLPPYGDILSHNSVSYWFSLDEYNIEGRIAKCSPEGEKLSKMIAEATSVPYVRKCVLHWCIKRLQPEQLIQILNYVREEAFREGKNAVRKSLAAVLEIE